MENQPINARYIGGPKLLQTAFGTAQSIVKRARSRASYILRKARSIRQKAYREGFQAGLNLAKEDSRKAIIEQVAKANQNLIFDRNDLIRFIAEDLEAIVTSIAQNVIGRELRQSQEFAREYLTRAISELLKSDPSKIVVNPVDLIEARLTLENLGSPLLVEEDPIVPEGTVQAIFSGGRMEISWIDHLNQIRPNVRSALISIMQER